MNTKLIIATTGITALMLVASVANADEVTGTISSDGTVTTSSSTTSTATTTTSGGSTLTGTVSSSSTSGSGSLSGSVATSSGGSLTGTVSSPTLTGTVTAPASSGGGGGGGGGGSNGPIVGSLGVSGVGNAIIPTGPATTGQVLGASTGPTEPVTPGVPNTGAGGNAAENMLVLFGSALAAIAGAGYLKQSRRSA